MQLNHREKQQQLPLNLNQFIANGDDLTKVSAQGLFCFNSVWFKEVTEAEKPTVKIRPAFNGTNRNNLPTQTCNKKKKEMDVSVL